MSGTVVVGIDFGGTKIAAAVCDLLGRRLASSTTPTDPARGGMWNLEQAVALAGALLEKSGGTVAAVGASTFGIPLADGVLLAPAIPGWSELHLRAELAERLSCPNVRVVTDVKAAASAEARSGALRGADPGIYLNLGTGLAVGIVCGGEVVSGANGAAGEIGYNLRRPADLSEAPERRVMLEHVVSGMGLRATAARESGVERSAEDLFRSEAGDSQVAAVLDGFVEELSFHLVNLAIAIDPARIAVGGGMVRSFDRIEPHLRAALESFVPFPPELVKGAYPFDAPLVGAITLALEVARGAPAPHVPGGRDGDSTLLDAQLRAQPLARRGAGKRASGG